VVNGRKHWITGGGVSVTNLIFVRFFDEKGAGAGHRRSVGGQGPSRLQLWPGGRCHGFEGHPETELIFEDCFVPRKNVVVMPDPEPQKAQLLGALKS
jgi:alkylation response protein AidB-like acyl-CoA dehydrogenase